MFQEKVIEALQEVRPMLQRDGGDIELVETTPENVVRVKLTGACGGCPMAQQTLKQGVERILKERVPEVASVESV
ncbi:MAG: NifU family protein [Fibrobacteria bacterium]|nr:NifU family protein [Fibrobacteria bacterium]